MSLANTLSVLLNFKTDLSGLERFSTGLRSRLEQVQEFNKKIANGAAAINSALQAGAAYLATGSLKSYIAEALEARSAQAKLAQALTQTKQNTAAYREELSGQSSVLQKVTGFQDELIASVQRQLVFGGAQRKDIERLTSLTLDFASAKEIDAVSAAKAVARALQGEGDELKRYGVEVDLSKNKTAALLDGLGKFSGQAAQAFASLPDGLRELQLASKEAKQSAGEAVLAIAGPFLSGLARGLTQIKDKLDGISKEGSTVNLMFRTISGSIGSLVGDNLGKFTLLLTGLLAIKSGGYLVNETIKLLSASFLFLFKQSLPSMLAGLQSLSKEVGILRALSTGGAAGYAAFGLTAASVAMIGYQIGKSIGEGIQSWHRSFATQASGGDQKVLDVMGAIDTAETPEKLKEAQDAAKKLFNETNAALEAEKSRWWSNSQAIGIYRQQLLTLGQVIGDAADPSLAKRNADKAYAAKYSATLKDSREWLMSSDADKARATIAAGQDSRTPLDERLSAARANLGVIERAYANRSSADTNTEKYAVQLLEQKEIILAKIGELEKEARARQANDLSREIGQRDIQIAEIENNNALTDRQKAEQIIPLLDEQNRLIAERIALREKELGLAKDDVTRTDLQKEIDTLRQQLAEKSGRATGIRNPETKSMAAAKGYSDLGDPAKHYQSAGDGIGGGLLEYLAEVGTLADQIAAGIKTTLSTAVSSVTSNIMEWGKGAKSFQQMLGGIKQALISTVLQTLIQIGAQQLVNTLLTKTGMISIEAIGDTLRTSRVAKENAAEAATLPAKTAGAAATGISSFGTALIFGALAIALIMGAMGGFAVGGYTEPGAKNKAVGVVHAGEWVAPKWMVEDPQYGAMIAGLESARNGMPGFASGGFFGKLTKSMQKLSGFDTWGQFLGSGGLNSKFTGPGFKKFQQQWNLLDGTKLYGGEASAGGELRTMSSADLASAIAARDSEGAASSDYVGSLPSAQSSAAASGGAAGDGQSVSVNVYAYIDWSALKADLRRDPAMNKHFVNLAKNG